MHGTAGLLSVICDNGVTVFVFLVRAKWIGGGAALFNCFVSPTWFSQQIGAGERVGGWVSEGIGLPPPARRGHQLHSLFTQSSNPDVRGTGKTCLPNVNEANFKV